MPNYQRLIQEMNCQLTCNQEARGQHDTVLIDIFRGSNIRRNRHKVATLKYSVAEVEQMLADDSFFDRITDAELKLNIPIYTIRESADVARLA